MPGIPRPPRDDDSEEEETPRANPRGSHQKSSTTASSNGSPAATGVPGGARIADAVPVSGLPISIQRAFRIKLLSILLTQLLISCGVGYALLMTTTVDESALNTTAVALNLEQHTNSTWLAVLLPPKTIQVLIFALVLIMALPMLGYIKDKHPWNLLGTTVWSVLWGVFMAASALPGGLVKSNSLFVIMGSAALGTFVLLLCAQLHTTNEDTGEKELWSFNTAGMLAWVIMVAGSFAFFSQTGHLYDHPLHFIMSILISSCIFAWVAFDASKLCKTFQPDEYMKGVTYFYTDFLLVCCCCLMGGMMASAAS